MRKGRYIPTLECLEGRLTPATFGIPWPDPQHLTVSFAPDGTSVDGQGSDLFQTLNARLPSAVWQKEILRAFQTWAVQANLNIGLVADGGQPFGTIGLKQGDARFGDIRIAAVPLGPDVVALGNPYDPFIANTSGGDILLNSNDVFGVGSAAGVYDLFTVLLHEAGHALSLPESSDPGSAMFESFTERRTGLSASDIASVQALYGPRLPDRLESPLGNSKWATATPLSLLDDAGDPAPALIAADLTTSQDTDVFQVTAPVGVTSLDVRLHAAGISFLVSQLQIYDSAGDHLAAAAADPRHNDLTLHVAHVVAGEHFFIKIASARSDVFGRGAYQLSVIPQGPGAQASAAASGEVQNASVIPPYSTQGVSLPDGVELLATTPGYVEHTYYEASDVLSAAESAYTYRIRSADIAPTLANIMTVAVRSLDVTAPHYQVQIYDAGWHLLAASAVVNRSGSLEVRVPSVLSNQDYYVSVSQAGSGKWANQFEVVMDFARDSESLDALASGTLGPDQASAQSPLKVTETEQLHLDLSATDWGAWASSGVVLNLLDASGQVVFTLDAASGQTRTGDVLLGPGSYTLRFTRDPTGAAQTPVLFELGGRVLSDPIEPRLPNPTLAPVDSAALPTGLRLFLQPLTGGGVRPGPAPTVDVPIFPSFPVVAALQASRAASGGTISYFPAGNEGQHGVELSALPSPTAVSAQVVVGGEMLAPPLAAGGSLRGGPLWARAEDAELIVPDLTASPQREVAMPDASRISAAAALPVPHRFGLFWALSMGASVLSWLLWPSRNSTPAPRASTGGRPRILRLLRQRWNHFAAAGTPANSFSNVHKSTGLTR
jgi:hypothetical protein